MFLVNERNEMKKILLTICCFVLMGGCSLSENFALVASNVEQEPEVQEYQRRQETLRQIENAKERAEQKLTPQRRMEYAKEHRARQAEEEYDREQELHKKEQELYKKEQEAKYERFRNEERYRKVSQEDVTYYNGYTVCYLSGMGSAEAFSLGDWVDSLLQSITKSNLKHNVKNKGEFYIKENFTEIIFKITRGGKNMFIYLIYDNNKVCLPKEMTADNERLLDCNEILMVMSMMAQ